MDNTNSRVAMTLPRMAFDITGLTYDAERKLGKLKQYKLQDSGDTVLRTVCTSSLQYKLWFVYFIKEY